MELPVMVGSVLLSIGVLYLVVFWCSVLWSFIYSYLQDGDSHVRNLCELRFGKVSRAKPEAIDYFLDGVMFPVVYLMIAAIMQRVLELTGLLVPIVLGGLLLAWLSIYTLRGVIRLNKKLNKHTEDKDAHQ